MNTEFGKRLKMAREFAGLTQKQLSDIAGIAQSTLSSAEKSKKPSGNSLLFARICNVNADWLAYGEGDMTVNKAIAVAEEGPNYLTSSKSDRVEGLITKLIIELVDIPTQTRETIALLLSEAIKNPSKLADIRKAIKSLTESN